MVRSLPGKAIRKLYGLYLQRVNTARYLEVFLGVDCDDSRSVHLYGKVYFGSEPWIISLGKNVHITDGVRFLTHDGGTLLYRNEIPDLEITKPICVGDSVYFGNNVIVMPGVTVGSNVVIGAGSVVTKDIPSNEVWAGVPARRIKSANEYLSKLKIESLHLGHLVGDEKDKELRKYYGR